MTAPGTRSRPAAHERAKRSRTFRAALSLATLLAAVAASAPAAPLEEPPGEPHAPAEPPPESPEGADYEAEPADSLDGGDLEVSFGASGRPGEAPRRTRRMRFSGDSLGGTLREGRGDPLAGGSLEGRARGGRFGFGRLAPRWGRGLVLGSPAEPWSSTATDRGSRAAFRGRSGEGAWFQSGERLRVQALYGRFARRSLAGLVAGIGGVNVGSLADRRGNTQTSLSLDRETTSSEWALDPRGRWRAEGALRRPLGRFAILARVRGGHAGFHSLAEPLRSGPAQALAVGIEGRWESIALDALGSLWRFRPGATGARAALEIEKGWGDRGAVRLGFEEQHGVRRDPTGRSSSPGGLLQGWWWDGRWGVPGLGIAIRHETWGTRSMARDPVRVVTTARVDARGPAGVTLRVTQAVFRVGRGASLYLPEARSDRLVLRALSGAGERTRLEVSLPAAGGSLRAEVSLSAGGSRPLRSQWNLDWTRRTRLKRRR